MLSDTDHKEILFPLVFLRYKPNIWLFLIKSSLQAKNFLFIKKLMRCGYVDNRLQKLLILIPEGWAGLLYNSSYCMNELNLPKGVM